MDLKYLDQYSPFILVDILTLEGLPERLLFDWRLSIISLSNWRIRIVFLSIEVFIEIGSETLF